jgi:2-methylcitrate dehydratase PrpD
MSEPSQTQQVCRYIAGSRRRDIPEDVLDEARKCLLDWTAVCVGAYDAPEASRLQKVMGQWQSQGQARMLWGGQSSAAVTALINGSLSHCLDYDDTHIPSVIHISGPLWAALLAVGTARGCPQELLLRAFITGFEVAARIGDRGVGLRLNNSGWHATATLGRLAVAAGVAVLLDLSEMQTSHALGLAATQASGLTASFGTMAKPLHVGKAAMDGLLTAELAQADFEGAAGVLDADSPLLRTLLQDPDLVLQMAPFDSVWEICRNSFKPYAACQLTHGAIDAARRARTAVAGRAIARMRVDVNPLAIKIANIRKASTPCEGRFSMGYCVALGLHGYAVTPQDFLPERLQQPKLRELANRLELVGDATVSRTAARLRIELEDGSHITEWVEHALGSIGNPLGWPELETKFLALVEPVTGRAIELLEWLREFGNGSSATPLFDLTRPKASPLA